MTEAAYVYKPFLGADDSWAEQAPALLADISGAFGKATPTIAEVSGYCGFWRMKPNTMTRALISEWYHCPSDWSTRQVVEVNKHPVVYLARKGEVCDVVCKDVSMKCESWNAIGAPGTLSDGGACSAVASNGGYCACGKMP